MSENREMCLVTGEVKYTVTVSFLVPKEDAQNEKKMIELFEERAYEDIDNSSCEAEYIDEVPVVVSKNTADEFSYEMIGNESWSKIIQEHSALRDNK